MTISLLKKILWSKNMKWISIQEASLNLIVNANVFLIGYPTVKKKRVVYLDRHLNEGNTWKLLPVMAES